jgi:ribosome-associated toxin RatA of RatAB toxin-antitoxin module
MQRVRKSVLVPFPAGEMFALVDDVERYPQFLPWCGGAHVLESHADGKTARIDPDACKIEFELAYEFATHLLERVVGPVFSHIADSFIDAFVRRAEALHPEGS